MMEKFYEAETQLKEELKNVDIYAKFCIYGMGSAQLDVGVINKEVRELFQLADDTVENENITAPVLKDMGGKVLQEGVLIQITEMDGTTPKKIKPVDLVWLIACFKQCGLGEFKDWRSNYSITNSTENTEILIIVSECIVPG